MKPSVEQIVAWVKGSELARERREAEGAFEGEAKRRLTKEEIATLERQGNSAGSWSALLVSEDFTAEAIFHSRFEGVVEIGRLGRAHNESLHGGAGIYHSTVVNARVARGARISRCDVVEHVFVGEGAALESVQRIGLTGPRSAFGNRLTLFEEQFYSRRLRAVTELPFMWAAWATGPEATGDEAARLREELEKACEGWTEAIEAATGYVGPGATVRATPVVENCWIGSHVHIDGASALRDSTLWATAEEPVDVRDGARLREALVGPGCSFIDHCSVSRSLLTEHVQVGTQAIVKGSVVGPNVRLAECEVNESLVGPFATAVHHGLVIAAWWPEGKGNIGYGANVGSNHTGRAPDQEIWPGEGVFFGLGCNIKFPCNFREAPYSVIATGVDLLPQRVGFPFSLIALPSLRPQGVPPALNEIHPGWNLIHSAYAIERQEQNLSTRNRARRLAVEAVIFRRDLTDRLARARRRLGTNPHGGIAGHYTSAEYPELGKNFMTESARRDAARAYELGARLGAARTLLRALEITPGGESAAADAGTAGASDGDALSSVAEWAAGRLGTSAPAELIEAALAAEREWYRAVVGSREKDWHRGQQILDDYAARHTPPDRDPVIVALRERIERLEGAAAELTARLEAAATAPEQAS